ncbi:MAG: aldose 1-epimerase family protein [Clostridium sp.]
MLYTLENDNIKISAHTHGGELHSLINKNSNTEYLWNGDASFWKYHAPILFPIVGKVNNGKYTIDGKTFELPQHGLARVREFTMIEKSNNSISFELLWNKESLLVYPYKFSLVINYTLVDDGVKITYKVKNIDDKEIFFSIGAHPAFMCPLADNETQEDYYFEFNNKETTSIMLLDTATGLFSHNRADFFNNENIIPITKNLFKNDALIFDSLQSNKVSIKSKNHTKSLTMDFSGFPYMALWSQPTGAPFVCLEPWFGHADYCDFNDDFRNKEGVESLKVNEEFTCSYTVTINE